MIFYSVPDRQVSGCLNIGLLNGCVCIGIQGLPSGKPKLNC